VSQPASNLDSTGGVKLPKARSNVYTVMLALAMLALVASCILLALELNRYDWELNPNPQSRSIQPAESSSTLAAGTHRNRPGARNS